MGGGFMVVCDVCEGVGWCVRVWNTGLAGRDCR